MKSKQRKTNIHTTAHDAMYKKITREKTVNHNFLPCFGIYIYVVNYYWKKINIILYRR